MTRIKAAVSAGVRPCAMVFREQPNREWTEMDFKLLEAYQTLQDEICPQCGQPVWLCRSTDDSIAWSVEDSVCYATKAKEEKNWTRENKRKKPTKEDRQGWGRFTYTVPVVSSHMPEGTELPTRKEYYADVLKS